MFRNLVASRLPFPLSRLAKTNMLKTSLALAELIPDSDINLTPWGHIGGRMDESTNERDTLGQIIVATVWLETQMYA